MIRPLHPRGIHDVKIVAVYGTKLGDKCAQCIFAGTDSNEGCYTISRLVSKLDAWAESSEQFFEQLVDFNDEGDLAEELVKYCGQIFRCQITHEGKRSQMNIRRFLPVSTNINGHSPVLDGTSAGQSQVSYV